jgi:hypothetical protein
MFMAELRPSTWPPLLVELPCIKEAPALPGTLHSGKRQRRDQDLDTGSHPLPFCVIMRRHRSMDRPGKGSRVRDGPGPEGVTC